MMDGAARAYEILEGRLLRGQATDTLSEEKAETIRITMDGLWRRMTAEERAAAEKRVQSAPRAPKSLGLVDVPVEEGESHLPREEEKK